MQVLTYVDLSALHMGREHQGFAAMSQERDRLDQRWETGLGPQWRSSIPSPPLKGYAAWLLLLLLRPPLLLQLLVLPRQLFPGGT